MAENKGNSGCLGVVVVFVVVFAIAVGLMVVGGDDLRTSPYKSSTATTRHVRTIDLEGVQFKVDGVRGDLIDLKMTDRLLALSVGAIRESGYRCDTVNSAGPLGPFADHPGFKFRCNGWRYKYLIEDRGGKWTVTLD